VTDATPRVFQTSGRVWLKDFEFGLTGLTVRKTGARVPYSPSVIAQVYAWFRYFFARKRIEPVTPSFSIYFTPERARPWYLIWAVSRAAGAKLAKDASQADVVMQFEDATYSPNDPPTKLKPGVKLVNFNCRDVSKTNVARACQAAFGNASSRLIPPPMLAKRLRNPRSTRRTMAGLSNALTPAVPGRVYQRVVDNRMPSRPQSG
jgi:hypothetical protein